MKLHLPTRLSAAAFMAAFLCSSIAWGGTPADNAKAPAVDIANQAWAQPLFGGGVKTTDVYTDGNIFLTVPIWSTIGRDNTLGGDYIFLEPYSSLGESGEVATSLGLSWRHLFSNEPMSALHKEGVASLLEEGWFLGANVFVDMLDTQHNNNFWQMGVGAEVGSRYLEVRGNYYIPMTGEKLYDREESTQTFSSSRSSTALNTVTSGYGDPFATGNSIVQPISSQTFATTSIATTTTTVHTITELFERGMEGWDVEASVLVPWLDQWMDLRLTGGYLSFDNQPFGPQDGPTGHVHGWKAGAELRPVPAVVLGTNWYEDKRFAGGNWVFSAELQIPLDKTWKDAFKMRRRHLVEHLAEPVHRQNDAIKTGNREDDQTTVSSSTSVRRVTKVVSQTATNLVLKDDIIFVNNGSAIGNGIQAGNDVTGNGTAEKPKATIQQGATIAGNNSNSTSRVWNVYTQGGSAKFLEVDYLEDVVTTGSTNFIGSGALISGQGGKTFGTNVKPVLGGSISSTGFDFLGISSHVIIGNSVAHPPLDVIHAQNVNVVRIQDNEILGAATHGIFAANFATLTVTNNSIHNVAGSGVVALVDDNAPANSVASITGNTIKDVGVNGVDIQTMGPATLTATVSHNAIISPGAHGVSLVSANSSFLTANLTNNTITTPTGDGVAATSTTTSSINLTATANTITSPVKNGFEFITQINSTESLTATLSSNTITGAGLDGIVAEVFGGTFGITASNNTITSPVKNGINLLSLTPVSATATVSGNTVSGAGSNGILIVSDFGGVFTAGVTGNTVVNAAADGIAFTVGTVGATSTMTANADNNIIQNPTGSGISALTGNASVFTLGASGNTITTPGGHGFSLASSGSSTLTPTLTGNTITTPAGDGVAATAAGTSTINLTAASNIITSPVMNGFEFITQITTASTLTAVLNSNTITDAGTNGVSGTILGGTFSLNATSNQITSPGATGISVGTLSATPAVVTLTSNTITEAGTNGVTLADAGAPFNSAITTTLNGNTITSSTQNGFNIQFSAGTASTVTSTVNNIVTGSGLFSLQVLTPGTPTNIILNGVNIAPLTTTP